jgi:hypothetical protein
MVTLAALCQAHDVSMEVEGDLELARIWMVIDQVRAKQAAKPKHSPLPSSPAVRYEIQSVRRLAGEVLLRAIEGAEVPQAVESGMSVSLEGIA